jgi:pyrimidine operon attenuation protein/uracil phosphoribosyltransferase
MQPTAMHPASSGLDRTRILDADLIERKLQRMAREIRERHYLDASLICIGIEGEGASVCRRLVQILREISDSEISCCFLSIHKSQPAEHPTTLRTESGEAMDATLLAGAAVVLVDDVLNSGKTLIYAVKFLLDFMPQRLSTAVLIDRIHRSFPVRADICGLSLSTSLKEHIRVVWGAKGGRDGGPGTEAEAYLVA